MNEKTEKIRRISDGLKKMKGQVKELISLKSHRRALITLIVLALGAGWLISSVFHGPRTASVRQTQHAHGVAEEAAIWTCSMHPQIQLPKPGQCPICGMDLIPLQSQDDGGMPSSRRLVMSPEAAKLAEIQTAPVERKFISTEIRMVGKVEYDETKIAYITAWTGGRIDRLYIDQTGIPVNKGDHLAYLYSPELLSAQEEYLQALESVTSVKESHLDIIKSTSADTVKNAREKLRLLGITDKQIQELEERKVPSDHMTIYATATGIVVKREVQEGDYVETGSRIYSIVDLSQVWIKLDAYEADLQWLRYGQDVEFKAEAYPGEKFHGRISFIDPILDERTRTVKVRVNVDNEDAQLKPGMFVRGVVYAQVAGAGRVMEPSLEGKWICPMHPEVLKDAAGDCPVCQMPLVPIEQMGYATTKEEEAPLVVPASAVLKTGKRAVVYVQSPNTVKPAFEGREIVVGPRSGDYYLVRSGLAEGEKVVTHGNFKIDSALQIQAKPSMMNPEGGVAAGGHDHGQVNASGKKAPAKSHKMAPAAFLEHLKPLYTRYFKFQDALARDNFKETQELIGGISEDLKKVNMNFLTDDELHASWMDLTQRIQNTLVIAQEAKTIDELRTGAFKDLSGDMLALERKFGHTGESPHYEVFCPMALGGQGAFWLQDRPEIKNPFYGAKMLKCGEIRAEFPPVTAEDLPPAKGETVGAQENHGGAHGG